MEEQLEEWLHEKYGGWRIAYNPHPRREIWESDFAAIFLWALGEYNSEFLETVEGLLFSRYPDKSPIEIHDLASIKIEDSGYQNPRIKYAVSIRSATPLAIGLYILELERHDSYDDLVPTQQTVNNRTMTEIIAAHRQMAEEFLAKRGGSVKTTGLPTF
jgi:hypothetical protein